MRSRRVQRSRAPSSGPASWLLPFLAGAASMAVATAVVRTNRRRGLDPALLAAGTDPETIPPVVILPGIMGSALQRPDGTRVWLNVRNAIGQYNLSLP
ncbi:MAG TPA: hypothetical protein VFM29_00435, partial [Vicinamibacteria bacterium]|nr:hypothetical protein [Vicinamibacteria bacterium]